VSVLSFWAIVLAVVVGNLVFAIGNDLFDCLVSKDDDDK
jgi:hypothetical protein